MPSDSVLRGKTDCEPSWACIAKPLNRSRSSCSVCLMVARLKSVKKNPSEPALYCLAKLVIGLALFG